MARERLLMDRGWSFHRGDIEIPEPVGHGQTYGSAKAGQAPGPAHPTWDLGGWDHVDLPHDWMVGLPYDPGENVSQGYRQRDVGWYARRFRLPESDRDRSLWLEFDGVARHCTVWLNGQLLHRNHCGYTSFRVDITDMARCGDQLNHLVLRVDGRPIEGWWYEGAGIYRHVWLVKTDRLHIPQWGVYVHPEQTERGWETLVETTLANDGDLPVDCELHSTLLDPEGHEVARIAAATTVGGDFPQVLAQVIPLADPTLWWLEAPALHTLRSEVVVAGEVVDSLETSFGYRTIRFDAEAGFFLNGEQVFLQGTCNHQDHAGCGIALPDSIHEWRIARLKEMGANAYRCAHNPPAPELLDACDRLGMLVMDENRHFNAAPEYLGQLRDLIRRDRNHPSVILWSLFNEEPLQGTAVGRRLAERMSREIRKLDDRPIVAAMNGGMLEEDGVGLAVDVTGFNYWFHCFDEFHERWPEQPVVASENNCALSTRGCYRTDLAAGRYDSYDREAAGWGATVRQTHRFITDRDWVAGYFVWTGFDYRGEPSPLEWPSINSHWGIMDTCGFAKDSFHLHRALWTDEPVLHLLPHWNWQPGDTVTVMVHTNCAEVELFLNGRSLGKREIDLCEQAQWEVPFAAGVIEAVGDGDLTARVETTGEPVALGLEPDREALAADGEDTMPVTVFAVDAQGRRVPTAGQLVNFAIAGPARILGVGNGDPTCHEPDQASARSLFNGLAMVLVQATDEAGEIRLRASAAGLEDAEIALTAQAVQPRPRLAVARELQTVDTWRVSAISAERPDPNARIADTDMNTWESLEVGHGPQAFWTGREGWAIYRATVRPGAGDTLLFLEIQGSAEVWIDGQKVGEKQYRKAPLSVPLPARDEVMVSVLLGVGAPGGGITRPVQVLATGD